MRIVSLHAHRACRGSLRESARRLRGFIGGLLHRPIRQFIAGGLLALSALHAPAAELLLAPEVSAINLQAGESFTVKGSITNLTGVSLLTTEIFLSISGYPADLVDILLLLGEPELPIADRTVRHGLDLFTVVAKSGISGLHRFDIEFFAVDVNGIFSATNLLATEVRGAAGGVPEPAAAWLLLAALLAAPAARRCTGSLRRPRSA